MDMIDVACLDAEVDFIKLLIYEYLIKIEKLDFNILYVN